MSDHPVVHFELPFDDAERAKAFYGNVFGWGITQLGEEMGNYVLVQTAETDENQMVKTPGTINGGLAPRSEVQQHPSVVISVGDIDAAIGRIRDAGGEVLNEPMDIPGVGKFSSFRDTEGNAASVLQPAM